MTTTEKTLTTFEKFAGQRAGNYSSNPTVDVEILDGPTMCGARESDGSRCLRPIVRDHEAQPTYMAYWKHADVEGPGPALNHHLRDGAAYSLIGPTTRCSYCGTQDPTEVTFHQRSWSDETECTRCGGVTGYAIGD